MRLVLRDELPFVTATVIYGRARVEVANVLVDTGSASTLINADVLATVGVLPQPGDRLRTLRGVGGREVVFARKIDRLEVGTAAINDFEIEVGGMDYGFSINGILGMDFLRSAGAILNLKEMTLRHSQS